MKVYDGSSADESAGPAPDRRKVGIAEYEVATGNTVLTTSGLGSCVGVGLYDPTAGVAGLVHVMLPAAEEGEGARAKFADTGVAVLLDAMADAGADSDDLEAKIAGGSDMLDLSGDGSSIGTRNVDAVREALDEHGVPIVAEDVGGRHGRSLRLEGPTGDLVVKSADQDATTL
ncbi:chemotaxis protein CheD [Halomicrobium salinisoli]|uniref:chemotaxis protein CheD n=1 Tax=Halomicrobium salinisoli TaxID=2878391 RepID=UPI001CEFFB89|nr:chemotaxis protein CheD [Halomicrobium salinisoli]